MSKNKTKVDISKLSVPEQIDYVKGVYATFHKNNPQCLMTVVNISLNMPVVSANNKGGLIIRDSQNMIEKGEVTVDGITCTEPKKVLRAGAYVRWGLVRYGHKQHCVVPGI